MLSVSHGMPCLASSCPTWCDWVCVGGGCVSGVSYGVLAANCRENIVACASKEWSIW